MDIKKALEDLTPEQREKYRACSSIEDITKLAKEEGYTLSDEELEAISGGSWHCNYSPCRYQKS